MELLTASLLFIIPDIFTWKLPVLFFISVFIAYKWFELLYKQDSIDELAIIEKYKYIRFFLPIIIWITTAFLSVFLLKVLWVDLFLTENNNLLGTIKFYILIGLGEEFIKDLVWFAIAYYAVSKLKNSNLNYWVILTKSIVLAAIWLSSYETFLYLSNLQFSGNDEIIITLIVRYTASMSLHIICAIIFSKIVIRMINLGYNKLIVVIFALLTASVFHMMFDVLLVFGFPILTAWIIFTIIGTISFVSVKSEYISNTNREYI